MPEVPIKINGEIWDRKASSIFIVDISLRVIAMLPLRTVIPNNILMLLGSTTWVALAPICDPNEAENNIIMTIIGSTWLSTAYKNVPNDPTIII